MSVTTSEDPIDLNPSPQAEFLGDSMDYADFFAVEFPEMVALGFALTGDLQAAEDAAQESLGRAHTHWLRVSSLDKPGAWVRRVTINVLRSRGRRLGAERRALTRLVGMRQSTTVELSASTGDFWRLVRRLPDRQKLAVALYYMHDLSVADIAVAMECAEGTAKAHLHKARTTLARSLEENR